MADQASIPSLSVLVSGCHSGPNPSAGLGVARSLRLAYPDSHLVAKDHSIHASGLHDTVFDEAWVCVPWNDIDLPRHRDQIRACLEPDAWLVSTQDLEIRWLAESPLARALVPPLDAVDLTGKPEIAAARSLPVRVPEWVALSASDQEVYSFCRTHNWRVWIKGRAYEAKSVQNWVELSRARELLGETWGDEALFAQADVEGWEVSIAFCALDGRLLDAVFMEKRLVTETGKTWAGEISDPPPSLREPLTEVVAALHWTGGGELEFVRDREGALWLIDWNPRFPAWVFGATLAGRNLPAQLLSAATGLAPTESRSVASQFTRVVTELPVRSGLALPPPPLEKPDPIRGGKNPAGMPLLMRRLAQRSAGPIRVVGNRQNSRAWGPRLSPHAPTEAEDLPTTLAQDLLDVCAGVENTPRRALLRRSAQERFSQVASLARLHADGAIPLQVAYSMKTNPDGELLHLAHASGFLAEAISAAEVRSALEEGFRWDQIVYNGPILLDGKVGQEGEVAAAFADSPSALRRYVDERVAAVVGVRVRPPLVESRFGVQLEEPEEFAEVVEIIRTMPDGLPLGVSIHVPSSEVGPARWEALARAALYFGAALQELTGKPIEVLDLGGGWAPQDLDLAFRERFPRLIGQAREVLPGLRQAIIEPGKSLVEPCGAVVCHVVELRRRGDGASEAVVDGSIAEVPLVHSFPHRLVAVSGERFQPLGRGEDRVLGRLCMEDDVLGESVALPGWLSEGDLLCVCDSGAYDASMAYRFGLGGGTDGRA